MKPIKLLYLLPVLLLLGCGKDNGPEEEKSGKLEDLVPKAYLDEAKQMGFAIHYGSNPPDISGTYRFAPWKFEAYNKNVPSGIVALVGSVIEDGFAAVFSNQIAGSIEVSYQGYYEGFENSKPWIMGSGNNFTVCRYIGMDACGANFRFNYMQMISGTKDGNVLRNVKMATIGLEALDPERIPEGACPGEIGSIEIWVDVDGVSNPE